MNLRIQQDCSNIDWEWVRATLKRVNMAYFNAEIHKKAFENSYAVVFIFDEDKLIGLGRALSDGAYQATLYDIAVLPEFQGQGIGRLLVENLLARLPKCNVILYAAVGKEEFYQKLGFKRLKTGMGMFLNQKLMQQKGFTE
ncbi:GNAT family N-acetyltransferase [Desulfitobacterium metallireducens]|uniref:Acetyltransferase n=1 Tax=Desulfitobacterium metallireducens DSM 15288 TaxID=871968 RepID=W0EES5_9FIRM|nr:GNAT family N-acetyltransferase [Desulfitobacterium metallireducens]AHF07581.1 acetyltransferase [Desulfitobacterium metallireducens DSM 15288]